jgi:hypothetical protein
MRNIYSDIQDQLDLNQNAQRSIKKDISELTIKLDQLKLEEYLLSHKLDSPTILRSDEYISQYRYLSEPVTISELGITLYPLWLKMECTYPKWSQDFRSINILEYTYFDSGKGYEILTDGLKFITGESYKTCRNFVKTNKLEIPSLYCYDYVLNSNIKIDFSQGEPLDYYKHRQNSYSLARSDDKNMVVNVAEIKFILLVSSDLQLN